MDTSTESNTALGPGITLVEASAGTGKTFQISQTILRLVAEEGIPVTRLLVVTFTEEATAELRGRIRRRLALGLQGLEAARDGATWEAPDEILDDWISGSRSADALRSQIAHLRQALVDFDEASISTIHAFCNRALRRFAFECRASFGADLLGEPSDLMEELAVDFWTRVHYDADPALAPTLKTAGVTLEALEHLVRKATDPDVPVIPKREGDHQPPIPDMRPWRAAYTRTRNAWSSGKTSLLNHVAGEAYYRKNGKGHSSFPAGRTRDRVKEVEAFFRSWPDVTRAIPEERGLRYFCSDHARRASRDPDSFAPHHLMPVLDDCVAAMEAIAREVAPLVIYYRHQLIDEVQDRLPERLIRHNARTYDQLLRVLRNALREDTGPLTRLLGGSFDAALIDEFQDTDPVQWEIFEHLFSDRMCLIGDPKQAIYGFRKADVHAYFRAKQSVPEPEALAHNHRSDGPLVQAINHLYTRAQVRHPFGQHIEFSAAEAVHGHRRPGDDRPALELRYLPTDGVRQKLRYWLAARVPALVAADVARELADGRQLVDEQGRTRPVTPRDCAVLVRKNEEARDVQAALRGLRIPTVIRSSDPVFKSHEAHELFVVLTAVLSPTETGPVKAALATELLGRQAGQIAALETDDQAWFDHANNFRRWHRLWSDDGFMAMFRDLMDGEQVAQRLLARPDGDRRMTNMVQLGELLHRAAQNRKLGPSSLVAWLQRWGPGEDAEEAQLRLETDADAVRVVTMHSAKGLEYPLVWCPYLWSNAFLGVNDHHHLQFHHPEDDHRLLLDISEPKDPRHLRWRMKENLEEDLRLVYVALTRARHRCVAYWGVAEKQDTALGYLLHQNPRATDEQLLGFDEEAWKMPWKDAGVIKALRQLAGEHDHIGASEVDWDADCEADPWTPEADEYGALTRRTVRRRRLDTWWRAGSFSSLRKREQQKGDEPGARVRADEDESHPPGAGEPAGGETAVALPPGIRGRTGGNCVHKILELHDFQAPDTLEEIVTEQLEAYGLDADELAGPTTVALQQVINAPWRKGPPGLRLADISRQRRLDELEFMFRVQGGFEPEREEVTARTLGEAFSGELGPGAPGDYAARVAGLKFDPLRGFLHGFIDLVFEHRGMWYIVDYKSNNLGPSWSDYHPEALRAEMGHAHYVLQYHLYTLALYRYLEWKLGKGAFESRFGGVYYLFVRGMSADRSPGHGVFNDRPPLNMVERLDAVFDARGGAS